MNREVTPSVRLNVVPVAAKPIHGKSKASSSGLGAMVIEPATSSTPSMVRWAMCDRVPRSPLALRWGFVELIEKERASKAWVTGLAVWMPNLVRAP